MLIKNEIPTEEPIISIGIVLPIDNQKTVEIFSTETNENYSISIDNNQISLNNKLNDIIVHRFRNRSKYFKFRLKRIFRYDFRVVMGRFF